MLRARAIPLTAITVLLAVAALSTVSWSERASAARRSPCAAWHVRRLLSGQGWLEAAAFDGRGSMTLSALSQGKLLRLSRGGRVSTLVPHADAPGAQVLRATTLYFTTGDSVPIGPTGTIDRLDVRTHKRSTWAKGLTMPNGLVFLPSGDAVISGAVPASTGLTRIRANDPRHPQVGWAKVANTNGLAVDPTRRWLYVDRDPPASSDGEVDRILISHPATVQVVGHVGAGTFPDDMSIDAHGVLYIPAFLTGKIDRLDPRTHAVCAIAGGINQPTDAVFGGVGWRSQDLYVTTAQGQLYELSPP